MSREHADEMKEILTPAPTNLAVEIKPALSVSQPKLKQRLEELLYSDQMMFVNMDKGFYIPTISSSSREEQYVFEEQSTGLLLGYASFERGYLRISNLKVLSFWEAKHDEDFNRVNLTKKILYKVLFGDEFYNKNSVAINCPNILELQVVAGDPSIFGTADPVKELYDKISKECGGETFTLHEKFTSPDCYTLNDVVIYEIPLGFVEV